LAVDRDPLLIRMFPFQPGLVATEGRAMTVVLKLASMGSIVLLLSSAYPAALDDILLGGILLSFLWVPALVIGAVIFGIVQARRVDKKPVKANAELIADEIGGGTKSVPRWPWIILSPAIVVLSLVMIAYGIPGRVAFALARPAFERYAASAPISKYDGEALGRWIGVYFVDRYGADSRGGVYFRTHAHGDGIGPDTMSYGFAYQPNPEGTPFGETRYCYSPIVGDWYIFSASND
jgi:hypothetical protein